MNPVNRILMSLQEHNLHSRPADWYSNLSDFQCSCGQLFKAASAALAEPPREVPSMAFVHRGEAVALTLGLTLEANRVIHSDAALEALPPYTVLRAANGAMIQKALTYDEAVKWITQHGQTLEIAEIATPAIIWWQPENSERTV